MEEANTRDRMKQAQVGGRGDSRRGGGHKGEKGAVETRWGVERKTGRGAEQGGDTV